MHIRLVEPRKTVNYMHIPKIGLVVYADHESYIHVCASDRKVLVCG